MSCNASLMEIASEKCVIAAANLKLGVKYDYSVSGSSYLRPTPGGNQRIPTCMLPYQNLRTTQGLQVTDRNGIQDKISAVFPGLEFCYHVSVIDSSICLLQKKKKRKILCLDVFYPNILSTQNTVTSSVSLSFLFHKMGVMIRALRAGE